MFVLTVDQDRSRVSDDLVPNYLAVLRAVKEASGESWAYEPERTVGDEVQCATDSPRLLVALIRVTLRLGTWQIGVGAAPHAHNDATKISTREARGEAFLLARKAVEQSRSKRITVPLCIAAQHGSQNAAQLQAAIRLLAVIYRRRSERAWQVIDTQCLRSLADISDTSPNSLATWATTQRAGLISQKELASILDSSPQTVSELIRRSAWLEELDLLPLLDALAQSLAEQEK